MENIFAHNISFLRKNKGMSQAKLGEILGLRATTISNWEKGLSFPDFNTLNVIINLFEVEPNKLIMSKLNEEINWTFPRSQNEKVVIKSGNDGSNDSKNEKSFLLFEPQEGYNAGGTKSQELQELQHQVELLRATVEHQSALLKDKEERIQEFKERIQELKQSLQRPQMPVYENINA